MYNLNWSGSTVKRWPTNSRAFTKPTKKNKNTACITDSERTAQICPSHNPSQIYQKTPVAQLQMIEHIISPRTWSLIDLIKLSTFAVPRITYNIIIYWLWNVAVALCEFFVVVVFCRLFAVCAVCVPKCTCNYNHFRPRHNISAPTHYVRVGSAVSLCGHQKPANREQHSARK